MDEKKLEIIMKESRTKFIKEKLSEIDDISKCLFRYSLRTESRELENIKRFFHTVKGTAAMLELTVLSAIGGEYEDYMDSIETVSNSHEDISAKLIKGLAKVHEELDVLNKKLSQEESNEITDLNVQALPFDEKYTNITNGGNILIVDDDVALLDYLEKFFLGNGYHVILTAKPQEILQLISEEKIDLIILDIIMPELSGFDVLELIKNNSIGIPIIFLTAKTLTEDKVKALRDGVDDYITKPFEADELLARVERIIKRTNLYKSQLIKDVLTGAYTRKYFNERVKEARARLQRKQEIFSIALMDLDNFKSINDTFGHQAGDFVLEGFSKEIRQSIRIGDQLFRFGGDEFLILLPDTAGKDAYEVIERVRKTVEGKKFNYEGVNESFTVTFSAGIATMEDKDETVEQLLKRADITMYESKFEGKGRTKYANLQQTEETHVSESGNIRKKILIIDDVSIITNIVEKRLNASEFEVFTASDGQSGLIKSKSLKPDLMVVDLMLPKLSGFEVCKQIKEDPHFKDTKIIVLSSRNKQEDVLKCFQIGVDWYMVKPFSPIELELRIKKILKMDIHTA